MNKLFVVMMGLAVLVLLHLLAPILTPFLVGTLLAYLANPLVTYVMRLRIPRAWAAAIVFLLMFVIIVLLVLLLVPLIETQIARLVVLIPRIIIWLQGTLLPGLKTYFGIKELVDVAQLKTFLSENLGKASDVASWIVKTILHSGVALLAFAMNLVLIPVVTFYLLHDWPQFLRGLRDLLPRRYEATVVKLVKGCDNVLSAFLRGQLLVMLTLGVLYSIGLTLLGLQVGLMIGLLIGVLSIVPYLGVITGIILASIAAFVQSGTVSSVIYVFILFAVVQVLDGMFITPKLVGGRIGLHPVAVIFAVLAGGTLYGFFGVLLALPVAAIIMVMLHFLNQRYRSSQLYR